MSPPLLLNVLQNDCVVHVSHLEPPVGFKFESRLSSAVERYVIDIP